MISRSVIGRMPSGAEIIECRLVNARATEAAVLTLGATLRALLVDAADGRREDVVLGFETAAEYLHGKDYFGATIGRYANRIANGRFSLHGRQYQLSLNDGPNSEHGGLEGFDRRLWTLEGTESAGGAAVSLALSSADGDQGYPGELAVQVTYTLTDQDELRIDYRAVSTAATVLNLTNHTYWNLAGAAAGDALAASLYVAADAYTPIDGQRIPTGELRAVAGTPFDFRAPHVIAARIRDGSEPQLALGGGYDHNFVLRGASGTLRTVARLADLRSQRTLELLTTEPGLQVYSGNFLSGTVPGKGRRLYRQGDGICLETQHFPDSPNQPHFPSTVLEPGQVWCSTTVYRLMSHSDIAESDLPSPVPARARQSA